MKYNRFYLLTLFIFFNLSLFSQTLKDLDPFLYELTKNRKSANEIEKKYGVRLTNSQSSSQREYSESLRTKHELRKTDSILYFGWEDKGGPAYSVAFNKDGTILASGGDDGTIRLWDLKTGKLINTLIGHDDLIYSISFSPDGTKLASGSNDNTMKLWDVSVGNLLNTFIGHNFWVTSVSFSPDGKKLASGSFDNTIKLWDVSNGSLIYTLEGHNNSVHSVSFSPDGTRLASGGYDNTIKLWDINTGGLINTLISHEYGVTSVSFSPDGFKLASGSHDNTVKLWDAQSGSLINTLTGHINSVYSVSFSPDGTKLASGGIDNTIRLWDVGNGSVIKVLTGHNGSVYSVFFSPDGTKLASSSYDNTIKLWDVNTGNSINEWIGHNSSVYSVSVSPDGGILATGSSDNTVKLWNLGSGSLINKLVGHRFGVTSVSFSPDGTKLASGSYDNTIKLWSVNSGNPLKTLTGHVNSVYSISFSPDGTKLASGSSDNTIKLWEVNTGNLIKTLIRQNNKVYSVAFSPDGTKLASGNSSNMIKLWDINTGSLIKTIIGHNNIVYSASFSPDGTRLATAGSDNTIELWDVVTGNLINTLIGHNNQVTSVIFSTDGSKLASGSNDRKIKIWDVSSGEVLRTIFFDYGFPLSINTNKAGSKIASGGWGYENLRLYEFAIPPRVITDSACQTTTITAILNGIINPSRLFTTYYFEYGTSSNYGFRTTVAELKADTNSVSVNINLIGLSPNVIYHYRLVAENSIGTSYGKDRTFRTLAGKPGIVNPTSINITSKSVVLGANVASDSGSVVIERGICWSTSANPSIADYKAITSGTIGPFSVIIKNLIPNTIYHYRGYAINEIGISYTNDTIFKTLSKPKIFLNKSGLIFDAIQNGLLPSGQSLLIKNVGEDILNWSLITDKSWVTLDPVSGKDSSVIMVSINSTKMRGGTYSAKISVIDTNAENSPQLIDITLNIKGPTISSNLSQLNFGNVIKNKSKELIILIKNNNDVSLNVSQQSITGNDSNMFSISSGGGYFNLGRNEFHSIAIKFLPISIGGKSATLQIFSDDSLQYPYEIQLFGAGIVPKNIVKISKDSIGSRINSELKEPFTIMVTDSVENKVPDLTMIFSIYKKPPGTIGDKLNPAITITDSIGIALSKLRLGNKVGEYRIRVQDSLQTLQFIEFISFASAGSVTIFFSIGGENQRNQISSELLKPFKVKVTDEGANPISGINVKFFIKKFPFGANGQSLNYTFAETDNDGEASSTLTLGDKVGLYEVEAIVDIEEINPVIFSAIATTPPYPSTFNIDTSYTFPLYSKSSDFKTEDWRIIGFPGAANITLKELMNGNQNSDWQVFLDNGNSTDYLERFDGSSKFNLTEGKAFWVITKGIWKISRVNVNSALMDNQEIGIPLHQGWNQITNPFKISIPWLKIQKVNNVSQPIWSFTGKWDTSSNFKPYSGYYFYNKEKIDILKIPYDAFFTEFPKQEYIGENNWIVNITLSTDKFIDRTAWFGISDSIDIKENNINFRKPRFLSNIPTVYFSRPEWDPNNAFFASDIRSPFDDFESWSFAVNANKGNQVQVTFSGVENIPVRFLIYLIDQMNKKYFDLKKDSIYKFIPLVSTSKFSILVGKENIIKQKLISNIIPKEFSLGNNYPNPFNLSTIIPISIPYPTDVKLMIYNILGGEVITIHSGVLPAGFYNFEWNGSDEFGKLLSSGTYICRMITDNGVKFSRKLILLK